MAGRKQFDEEDTNPGSGKLAAYRSLALVFDHFDPPDQFALIDHVNTILSLSKEDRATIYQLTIRLEKR